MKFKFNKSKTNAKVYIFDSVVLENGWNEGKDSWLDTRAFQNRLEKGIFEFDTVEAKVEEVKEEPKEEPKALELELETEEKEEEKPKKRTRRTKKVEDSE